MYQGTFINLLVGSVSGHQAYWNAEADQDQDVNAISDGKSLQTSTCSTCQVQDDHSAYWTPSMFYQHPDGTFESVPNDGMTVYYVGR